MLDVLRYGPRAGVLRVSRLFGSLRASPAGVALIGRLEFEEQEDVPWFGWPKESQQDAVHRVTASMQTMSFGIVLAVAAEYLAGPWGVEALLALPYLYEYAPQRRLIAGAVSKHFRIPTSSACVP
jgi:hypothetical protein